MLAQDAAHTEIYQVLDDVIGSGIVPPGAKGKVFGVIDTLRSTEPSGCELRLAERLSVALNCLEQSLNHAQASEIELARMAVRSLAAEWLDCRIASRM